MLRDKSNKRNRICTNLLAILSKSGTAMAVLAVPVATALHFYRTIFKDPHTLIEQSKHSNKAVRWPGCALLTY